jgi:hypothetical protein
MNATNNYLFKYITLYNSILFKNQGVTLTRPNYLTRSFSDQTSIYPIISGHLT